MVFNLFWKASNIYLAFLSIGDYCQKKFPSNGKLVEKSLFIYNRYIHLYSDKGEDTCMFMCGSGTRNPTL